MIDESLLMAYNVTMNINLLKQYKFPGINNSISVSTMVYRLQVPFDRDGISKAKAIQLGISQKEILEEWDAKAAKGKATGIALHNYIGQRLRGQPQDQFEAMSSKLPCRVQFDKFWAKASKLYELVWVEIPITSVDYKITGRVDALMYHTEDKIFHVVDWKSGKWSEEGFNNLKSPFIDLRDSTLDLGAIQTGIYRAAIQKSLESLNITLGTSYLVHLSDQASVRAMTDLHPRIVRWLEQEARKRNGR